MVEKTIIIGGGICGLAIGWNLARAGQMVTIIEKNMAGRAASWAAGGMLAPEIETEPSERALSTLLLQARDLWPQFARDLEQESGEKIFLEQKGSFYVATDRDDLERLKFLQTLEQDYGLQPELLSGYDARKLEPHLSRNVIGALHHKDDAHVDNRAVCRALIKAFQNGGGTLIEQTEAREIVVKNTKAVAVKTAHETIEADHIILAAGAWSAEIKGLPENCIPPVRPVKGQMIALSMPPSQRLIDRLVWNPRVYLIPQPDRLLIGASVEEMGFNNDVTAGALKDLLEEAFAVLPGIYDLPVIESWAGLRPTSRDDAPILGKTPVEGLFLATGHHRNGILLTPLTAQSMQKLLIDGQMDPAIAPFTLARFAA